MTQDQIAEVIARTALCEAWDTLAHTARVVDSLRTVRLPGELARNDLLAAGWLHDVIEDMPVSLNDLADCGIDADVILAVALRRSGVRVRLRLRDVPRGR